MRASEVFEVKTAWTAVCMVPCFRYTTKILIIVEKLCLNVKVLTVTFLGHVRVYATRE